MCSQLDPGPADVLGWVHSTWKRMYAAGLRFGLVGVEGIAMMMVMIMSMSSCFSAMNCASSETYLCKRVRLPGDG